MHALLPSHSSSASVKRVERDDQSALSRVDFEDISTSQAPIPWRYQIYISAAHKRITFFFNFRTSLNVTISFDLTNENSTSSFSTMDIFGTIRNAIELTKDIVDLIDDFRGAESEKRRLMLDIKACEHILQSLCVSEGDAQGSDTSRQKTQQDIALSDLLQRFHSDLSTLTTTLRTSRNSKWPFVKGKVETQHRRIECDKTDLLVHMAIRGGNSNAQMSTDLNNHLQKLSTTTDAHSRNLSALQNDVSKLVQEYDANSAEITRQKLSEWLAPLEQGEKHSTIRRIAAKGTGDWLLRSDAYLSWHDGTNGTLFLCGEAGAGKTFLTSLVIENLGQSPMTSGSIAIAYYYCESGSSDSGDVQACIRTLLSQLLSASTTIPDELIRATEHNPSTTPGMDILMKGINHIAESLSKIILVVDAIDEFSASEKGRQDLLECLMRIQSETRNVNLLVTSRPLMDVSNYLKEKVSKVLVAVLDEDLILLIKERCEFLPKFVQNSQSLIAQTQTTVAKKSQGLFLLADLHMKSLISQKHRYCNGYTQALDDLSKTLQEAYRGAIGRISRNGDHDIAIPIFQFLSCAKQPLTVSYIRHALSIREDMYTLDAGDLYELDKEDIVSICTALVMVLDNSDIVRFSHSTIHDFFSQTDLEPFPQSELSLAIACISYLLLGELQAERFPVFSEHLWSFEMRERYPFYEYAVRHWATHARNATQTQRSDEMVRKLLESSPNAPSRAVLTEAERGNKRNVDWLLEKVGETPSILELMNEKHMTFFQLACYNGWTSIIENLLKVGTPGWGLDVNNMTPLHYSVMRGCQDTARILIDVARLPIDLSIRRAVWKYDQEDGLPHWEPHLDESIPHEVDQSSGLTALHFAVLIGNVSMTRFLIAHGANVNHSSAYKEGILHVALEQCVQGHRTSLGNYDAWDEPQHRIESSLDFIDFEPEFEDEYQQTVRALEEFRLEILDALLETDALDIHAKDIHDRTSLHCIKYQKSSGSEIEILPVSVRSLQKLIAKGAISSTDDQGRLPLHLACKAGDTAAVRVLLQANADLEATDHNGRNALHFAAKGRCLDTIGTILETARQQGCSERLVLIRDIFGQNALHHALRNGWVERDVVAYLADAGVITDHQDMSGKSPLAMYLEKLSMNGANMAGMMEVLFSAGADPAYLSKEGLGYHHLYAHTALVLGIEPFRVLQRYGIDITTTDSDGRSLAHHCAMNGHCTVESLDFFTGLGMPLQLSDAAGITPLQYANIAVLRVRHINEWDSDRWGPSRATLHGYIASLLSQQ